MNKTGAKLLGSFILLFTAFAVYYILTSEWLVGKTISDLMILIIFTPFFATFPDILKRYSMMKRIVIVIIIAIITLALIKFVSKIFADALLFGFIVVDTVINLIIGDDEYTMNSKSILAKTTISMVIAGIILAYLQQYISA